MTRKLYDYQQTSLYPPHRERIPARLDDTPLAGTCSIVISPFLDVSQTSILKTSLHLAEATSLAGRISIATSPSWVATALHHNSPLPDPPDTDSRLHHPVAFAPLAGNISVATSSSHTVWQIKLLEGKYTADKYSDRNSRSRHLHRRLRQECARRVPSAPTLGGPNSQTDATDAPSIDTPSSQQAVPLLVHCKAHRLRREIGNRTE
ncbi:hypothetical protein D9611_005331 [Ephemerocybe angulata]|uniref:Uncharacterized protein n=1 Tax=Ephemerocybe angulata TaxID=980116 RepID=A0A8H5C1X5_9AGAR|nr:hypothetical protein D9611_005331 [Tulosesus angulatus]